MIEEEEIEEQETEEPEGDVPAEGIEASLDEILAKKGEGAPAAEEEAEEPEPIVPTARDERVEPLAVKVVPQQPTEFTCKKCFLVKHRSQLADKKRMYCRDCA